MPTQLNKVAGFAERAPDQFVWLAIDISPMSSRTETEQQIMEATMRALMTHGYANTTISDVSDEFEKSPSLIYHYYDSKEELMAELYDFLSEVYFKFVRQMDVEDPVKRLRFLIEIVLSPHEDDPNDSFYIMLYEIITHVPHSPLLKEKYIQTNRKATKITAEILREGMETGQIKQIDALETAAFLSAAIDGIRLHRVLLNDDATVVISTSMVKQWLIDPLLTEDGLQMDDDRPQTVDDL